MKTIVSVQEVSEFEIKPPKAIAEWLSLVESEVQNRWSGHSGWHDVQWPACSHAQTRVAFRKLGFEYVECLSCGSLFVPHRPSEDELWWWYRESRPAQFWRQELLQRSEAIRDEKITIPRADWISEAIAEYVPDAKSLIDLSTHGRALTNHVVRNVPALKQVLAAGITADLEKDWDTRVSIQPVRLGQMVSLPSADVVLAVDILDRTPDIGQFTESLKELVSDDGILLLTCVVSSGFEVQTLWDKSPSLVPPDRLNVPSIEALQLIFSEPDWKILELSTPGVFDLSLIRRVIKQEQEETWPRVVHAILQGTHSSGEAEFVGLLQSLRMTSFARLVARRTR